METLDELKTCMKEKNINNIYLPNNKNNRYVTDIGEGLEEIYGLYIWYYSDEKVNRTDIDYFKSEKEAVIFVFNQLNHRKCQSFPARFPKPCRYNLEEII